jgi:asparagine synthase (glutamine-hydrolysing)
MCGIFGQYSLRGADPALIERMAQCLKHRGPDGYGTYHKGILAFGAGRLAIIDLAAGVQPIFNEDRSIAVVFNGEIYNYKLLRAELEAMGHVFTTHTDTEVIVHGYEAWGVDVLDHLRGMFGVGIWDEAQERLLLARDRLGEKPLYYAQVGEVFLFASEIKALFEYPHLKREVNPDALAFYLTLGYTAPPMTMFRGIEKLSPGERLIVNRQGKHRERYWQPVMDTREALDYDQAVIQLRQMLTEVVEMRLMSDVPLGGFLSGGLDSTAIVALMGKAMGRPVQTFTVGFDFSGGSTGDKKFNVDARFAALAAERFGTDHHAITVQPGNNLAELLPHLIYALDEPVAQPAIFQTAYVAALARQSGVPVLLSGDGSDELFAGYYSYRHDRILERYLQIPALVRNSVLNPVLKRAPSRFENLRTLAEKSYDTIPTHRYLTWMKLVEMQHVPGLLADPQLGDSAYGSVEQVIAPLLAAPKTSNFADRIAFTSLNLWLAEDSNMRVDKMCMAMSIEARAPFQDHKLVELALRTPLKYKLRGGDFKTILKSAVGDLVPQEILERPKWGFFPPISDWLRTVLRPLVDTYLSRDYVASVGWLLPDAVARIVDEHIGQHKYRLWQVWPLLVFHLWYALNIDGSLTLDHQITPAELVSSAAISKVSY